MNSVQGFFIDVSSELTFVANVKFLKILESLKIKQPEYFLLIGAGRGGTSLLASMIDYHPKVKVGFERFAFDFLLGEKLESEDKNDINSRLEAFKKSCKEEAVLSKALWGNKITTEQILALEDCQNIPLNGSILEFTRKVVRSQKVIFIVRDGRHCILSKMKRTGQGYERALQRWKYSTKVLNEFSKQGVNLHLCRYEDLLQNPEGELSRICEFLGVQFERDMLKGPSNSMMPEMYAGKGLRPVSELTEEQKLWTKDIKEELEQLGYLNDN
ncbi:sulfotransferase family protein [Owenweeksia hongkongensis]|uniref:sulfotransferase family protein n=1 Tax=Owenweeksia hongkongensis TaxID=253245 RepID=UPI003A94231E